MFNRLAARFQVWSQVVEARFGAWPTWRKLAVFMPILVLMTAILMAALELAATAAQYLTRQ